MTYQQCVLGTITYASNPNANSKNDPVRSVTRAPTWNGQIVTDWGAIAQDGTITQAWGYMQPAFYAQLKVMRLAGGTYSFTDELGVTVTVVIGDLAFDGLTPGGDLYIGVKLELWVR